MVFYVIFQDSYVFLGFFCFFEIFFDLFSFLRFLMFNQISFALFVFFCFLMFLRLLGFSFFSSFTFLMLQFCDIPLMNRLWVVIRCFTVHSTDFFPTCKIP